MDSMELTEYFGERAQALLKSVIGNSLRDPKGSSFLLRFGLSLKRSQGRRESYEKEGLHVPMFLICSITSSCNLRCKGCYARANGICGDVGREELSDGEWDDVFQQAYSLGIPFIILAGGEPMMRMGVMEKAAGHRDIAFPVFTNGTMVSEDLDLFMDNRNLIPVLSLEGGRDSTDDRRGAGAFDSVMDVMSSLGEHGILYGASVTVTTENASEVLSDGFMDMLESRGCRVVFLIEFVPSDRNLVHLAPDDDMREDCLRRVEELRLRHEAVIMSFPGDEAKLGGCLGAGRGFFHINPFGDAEACPASPYSDVNVRDGGLDAVLRSDLFRELRMNEFLSGEHSGGCVLLEREDEVRRIVDGVSGAHR
ncbi:MAG: radical SAM/SPASM domain-containing protein [Candidatus Methanomethylophilaceae archaeon]